MTHAYARETQKIARERSADIAAKFVAEVTRLLNIGAIDEENHSRGMVFGVALENIADDYLRGDRKTASYINLKRF